jgi:SeqA protein N-terminal domain
MNQMKTIEIDFDIHRLIEIERKGFDESENSALRRLLNLSSKIDLQSSTKHGAIVAPETTISQGRPWSGKGLVLPHGTELRMEYRGQVVRGVIENGVWSVEGNKTTSPSDAAGSAVVTKNGERPSLNGWVYWEVKRPTDATWRKLKSMKPR